LRPTGKEIPIRCNQCVKQICAIGIVLLLGVTTSVGAVAKLLTLGLALCWVRFTAGATLGDLGIVPGRLWADIQLGIWAFLAITIPVYVLLAVATSLLPENTVADPIPLLLLAAVLGGLYYRSHRIVPAIVLHMAFNATSVSLALWTLW